MFQRVVRCVSPRSTRFGTNSWRRRPLFRYSAGPAMLKLFHLIRPFRAYVAIVLVLALAQSLGFLLLPRLMSDIVDQGIVRNDQRAILQTGGLMLLMSVVA